VADPVECRAYLSSIRVAMDIFYNMNPSVGSDCSGVSPETYYCISTGRIGLYDPDMDDDDASTSTPTMITPSNSATPLPIQV